MPEDEPIDADGRVFSVYGIASTVLAVIAVAAVVLAGLIWSQHRDEDTELGYQTRVLQTAIDWTTVLINMNAQTVDASMAKLHDGTVGQLNADFDAAVQPYRQIVQQLKSATAGRIDSVSIESLYHQPPPAEGAPAPPKPGADVEGFAARTDTVLIVATSVSQNAGAQDPQTVRWNLRVGVSDIDGQLKISRLEPIR
jgi:hypothetical protein